MKFQSALTIGTISFSLIFPQSMDQISPYLMVFCILFLGIPHGALDHILYYELESIRNELPEKKKYGAYVHSLFFYVNYLVIMILWSACWDTQPQIAFWTFLAVSSYHFGESDLDYIQGISNRFKALLYCSRGVLLVGLTLTTMPKMTLPIIEKLIEMDPIGFYQFCNVMQPLVIVQHLLLVSLLCMKPSSQSQCLRQPLPSEPKLTSVNVGLYELARSMLYISLFLATNPLIGFSIYFGIWHSTTTMHGTIQFLKKQGYPSFEQSKEITWKDVISFYLLASPFTTISVIGMGIMYNARSVVGLDVVDPPLVWAVFICCISILTGSHMWILTALHWAQVTLDPCNLGIFFGAEQAKKRIKSK